MPVTTSGKLCTNRNVFLNALFTLTIMKKTVLTFLTFIFLTTTFQAQVCVGIAGQVDWEVWNNLYDDEYTELSALPHFPDSPDDTKILYKLSGPSNYNDLFGARVRGFLSVPTTSTVTFNTTANRYVKFYLSTDNNPVNLSLVAYTPGSVNREEHDAYPEQTSNAITLTAGQYYYFEIDHIEGYGGDHFTIYWKTDLVDINNWNIITAAYLHSVGCADPVCPEAGTPCDDGDASTLNDIEDGHCNCYGEKITSNPCIGPRGKVVSYRYDNIPGGSLNDLYEAPNFPGMPAYSEQYEYFSKKSSNDQVDVGHSMQAFLTVPVTGLYKFNVTGDDNTILFLSSDETFENRQSHQMLVSGWTYMTEHHKYIYQSSSNIFLEKGQYYYIEINQKDGGGSEHFSAFWQTPFTEPGKWKRIPAHYFHNYECEVACIPQGTPCDDGDPFTNNDMYDGNCDCTGTPCSGPDCDSPLANYVPYDPCSLTDQLDNNPENNWVSCQVSPNPNNIRGIGHWILYDLGERFELYQTQIWNYNVTNNLTNGMETVAIDYSPDGNNWQEFGTYNWPLASGDPAYTGFSGPNFNGLYARYILISSLDGGAACKGLGKIAFTAVLCPLIGTPCDDNDENTLNDQYNDNCECKGSLMDKNDCVENNVMLGDSALFTSKYSAIQQVMSISDIAQDSRVAFVGGKSVILDVGFETNGQTLFMATIDSCDTSGGGSFGPTRGEQLEEKALEREQNKIDVLTVTLLEDGNMMISYYVEKPGKATLTVTNMVGEKLYTLADHDFKNQGLYRKVFPLTKFIPGNYQVNLTSQEHQLSKRMTVGN
jgi:hypothetical protein